MSIEGQGHFFILYFTGFVCFAIYLAKISGERLQDHWSSVFSVRMRFLFLLVLGIGCVIVLWHSLCIPYYFNDINVCKDAEKRKDHL